jgi:hypothetical protein
MANANNQNNVLLFLKRSFWLSILVRFSWDFYLDDIFSLLRNVVNSRLACVECKTNNIPKTEKKLFTHMLLLNEQQMLHFRICNPANYLLVLHSIIHLSVVFIIETNKYWCISEKTLKNVTCKNMIAISLFYQANIVRSLINFPSGNRVNVFILIK